MRLRQSLLTLTVLTAVYSGLIAAQTPASVPKPFAPSDRVPFDSAVTTGTLPNGLRYYIRKNSRPEKRVVLRLVVKAGSVD